MFAYALCNFLSFIVANAVLIKIHCLHVLSFEAEMCFISFKFTFWRKDTKGVGLRSALILHGYDVRVVTFCEG